MLHAWLVCVILVHLSQGVVELQEVEVSGHIIEAPLYLACEMTKAGLVWKQADSKEAEVAKISSTVRGAERIEKDHFLHCFSVRETQHQTKQLRTRSGTTKWNGIFSMQWVTEPWNFFL